MMVTAKKTNLFEKEVKVLKTNVYLEGNNYDTYGFETKYVTLDDISTDERLVTCFVAHINKMMCKNEKSYNLLGSMLVEAIEMHRDDILKVKISKSKAKSIKLNRFFFYDEEENVKAYTYGITMGKIHLKDINSDKKLMKKFVAILNGFISNDEECKTLIRFIVVEMIDIYKYAILN